ncbi:MAG: nucleoside triphosphate pyrophosphohydrolase family protein [Nitrospinae bacterium]|nr:nucleoside triphosphate pyrophosphohydrolase family protein [Nitrospinota bacterium]
MGAAFSEMMERVRAFHLKHDFANTGGEEMKYRICLMAEELGEISAAVTKGKSGEELAEEIADLLILVMGCAIAMDFDMEAEFYRKMEKLMKREAKFVNGVIRVTDHR